MRLFIFLQVLLAIVQISQSETNVNGTLKHHQSDEQANESNDRNSEEFFDGLEGVESNGNELDFDYDDDENGFMTSVTNPDIKEPEMQEVLLKAMKKPAIRKQIGEVIPILRVMSPAQRLTLAALVSSQIMSQNTISEENLTEMATMIGSKNLENQDDRHNITEQLLLPISMDIAKMFKGLGKEMGRNLRENFYKPFDHTVSHSPVRRVTRKPVHKFQNSNNRRMDVSDYDESDEKPIAEALKQPGKDECDFFTKSLCLEVPNYPTEAIISSIRKNQDIAKTFLTDFEVPSTEKRNNGNGRRLERRRDGQNEVQTLTPDSGLMCPSSVKYARPKRARTTSGQWKYVVNAGDYTQTLRLEICLKPKSACSYVTNHLDSECTQIYNYHRLLTWDESKGLHLDVFKVPSCCSCHIQGYSTFFPPNKDFTYAEKRREPTEVADPILEQTTRPPFGYVGNKREIPKHVAPTNTVNIKTQPQQPVNPQDFYRNPVDHLIPPGPPLPLENERFPSPYLGPTFSQKKTDSDQSRRYPVQAEYRRVINPGDSHKEALDNRLKASSSERSNVKIPGPIPGPLLTEPSNRIQSFQKILKPPTNTPPPVEIREKPAGVVYITPYPEKKQNPTQYFKPEDNKGFPSKISSSYVTPPKVKIEHPSSSSPKPPLKSEYFTSTGQRKINYNYHPIIDFFLTDFKKKQPPQTAPKYIPLNSQDWTPVLGH